MSAYRNNSYTPEPSMNKLQSFFATIRMMPFWRFVLTLAMIGGVGIGGHAIYGAAKGCAMKPSPPPSSKCVESVDTLTGFHDSTTCPLGARMIVSKSYPTIVQCVCDRPNDQIDGGN